MQIELLEGRLFFTSAVLYPAPDAVAGSAIATINASPTEVLQTAGNSIDSPQATADPAVLNFVEYHEGFSLFVYPDALGRPIIGAGLDLDQTGGTSGADTLFAEAGLDYSSVIAGWNATQQLWVQKGHALSQLRTGTTAQLKAWQKFTQQDPLALTPVITDDQADELLADAVAAVAGNVAGTVGPQFYLLDRDPQMALIDLAFDAGGSISAYPKLVSEIQGDSNNATDYAVAAADVPAGSNPVGSAEANRLSDDRALIRDGEFPTILSLSPSSLVLTPGGSAQLVRTEQSAHGKDILLADDKFSYVSGSPQTVAVNQQGMILAGSGGTTTVLFSLVDDPAINVSVQVMVNDGTSVNALVDSSSNAATVIAPPNVVVGDTIDVSVTVDTTTPNVDGNGGVLTFTSDNGFSVSIDNFNRPVGFSTIATSDGQTLLASISGMPDDESANIVARVIIHPAATFSSTVVGAFSQLSMDLDAQALTALTTASTGTPSRALVTASYAIAAQAGLLANEINAIAAGGSPDAKFQLLAPIAPVSPYLKPFKASSTLPASLASSLSAEQSNAGRLLAVLEAAATTSNRVESASAAGSNVWVGRQQNQLAKLNRTAAALLKRQQSLLARVSAAITRAGSSTPVDSSDALTTEQDIQANGLPFLVVQMMEELGGDAVAATAIQGEIFAQNSAVVGSSLAAELTASGFSTDLVTTIAAL